MFDLSIILTMEFGIFGITITIYTVLYSFILNKRNELSIYTDSKRMQNETYNPILNRKIVFVEKYIKNTIFLNKHLLVLAFSSFILGSISFIIIVLKGYIAILRQNIVNLILFILSILSLIYIFLLLIAILKRYIKEIKVK